MWRTGLLALALLVTGCIGAGDPAAPATSIRPFVSDDGPRVVVIDHEGHLDTSFTANNCRLTTGTTARHVLPLGVFPHGFNGVVLTMEWSAATPMSQELSMLVRVPTQLEDCARPGGPINLLWVTGTSPIQVIVPADAFDLSAEYYVLIWPSEGTGGVAVEQPFHLRAEMYVDMPLPA